MLIDFTVENFRSIKEPVTLSMVAQSRANSKPSARAGVKPDDEIAKPHAIGNRDIDVLPTAGIFGANASGKSNVLFALSFLLRLMNMDLFWAQEHYGLLTPFRLDEISSSLPTRFEIRIAVGQVVYSYSLTITAERIIQEHLEYLLPQPNLTRHLFDRNWDPLLGEYSWKNGPDFSGPHVRLETALQHNTPFLSLLINNLDVPPVRPLSDWLIHLLPGASRDHERRLMMATESLLYDRRELLEKVVRLVVGYDTGLSDIKIERTRDEEFLGGRIANYELKAVHYIGSRAIFWPMENESTGTQKLLPLAVAVFLALDSGTPVLFDDFGSSLHPEITHTIVRMFQDEKTNPKRAQLIFNSHDYTLMRGNLLRRDQIWFTQKKQDGSTELYPLTDFQPRNDLAIDKAYIDGRFGAVPILPAEEDLLPTEELVELMAGPFQRPQGRRRQIGRKVLIACEGTKTERGYFNAIRASHKLSTVQVVIVRTEGPDPLSVVSAVIREREEQRRERGGWRNGDTAWAVFDGDEHIANSRENWNEALRLADRQRVQLAISNLCFEFWYLLHFRDQFARLTRN